MCLYSCVVRSNSQYVAACASNKVLSKYVNLLAVNKGLRAKPSILPLLNRIAELLVILLESTYCIALQASTPTRSAVYAIWGHVSHRDGMSITFRVPQFELSLKWSVSAACAVRSWQLYVLKPVRMSLLLLLLAAGEWAIEAATGGPFPEDKGLVMKVSHGCC